MPKMSPVASARISMPDLAARLNYSLFHFRKIFYGQRPCPEWLKKLPKPRRCGRENSWYADDVEAFLRNHFSASSDPAAAATVVTEAPRRRPGRPRKLEGGAK